VSCQYRNVILVSWADEKVLGSETRQITSDTASFWIGIASYTNVANEHPFYELVMNCLACCSLPVSNTVVERIFSVVCWWASPHSPDSMIRIRMHFMENSKCCRDFVVKQTMVHCTCLILIFTILLPVLLRSI